MDFLRLRAHWQARTTETQEIALELAICLDAIDKMARLWDIADDEDRKGMAQNLFDEVVVNLDTRRIESFRLKPWADRFLVLRMELYRDDYPEIAEEVAADLAENETPPADEGQGNHMPHRGLERGGPQHIFDAITYGKILLYIGLPQTANPRTDLIPTKHRRNEDIRARYAAGDPVQYIAKLYGISEQRVSQIVHGRRD